MRMEGSRNIFLSDDLEEPDSFTDEDSLLRVTENHRVGGSCGSGSSDSDDSQQIEADNEDPTFDDVLSQHSIPRSMLSLLHS